MLGVIAHRPYVNPDSVAHAQGSFAGVQFTGEAISFFDTRTGEYLSYNGNGTVNTHLILKRPGPAMGK